MIEVELRIDNFNNKSYYIKGTAILHREDGSAIEYDNGDKFWYQNDQLHRLNDPAIEYSNGDKSWWQNGKCHRLDGPAIEHSNGVKSWHINNIYIYCQTQKEFEKIIKLKAFW